MSLPMTETNLSTHNHIYTMVYISAAPPERRPHAFERRGGKKEPLFEALDPGSALAMASSGRARSRQKPPPGWAREALA